MSVSTLGFGCMGLTYNRSQHPDKKQMSRLMARAVDCGVTLFDTAIVYGPLENELFVGEALAPYKGRINITTKFGHEIMDGKATGRQTSRPDVVRRYCEESLRRLRLDSIPLFYQHRFDCPLTAIQSEYHLMHRLVEKNGVLDVCRELGIGFVPYSPINRGFLGGDINEYTQFDAANDNRQTLPRFQPEAIRLNTRIVNVLQRFGRTRGMTSAQVALAWLLAKAPFIVPIPGTTKQAHLYENLHTLDFTLSGGEIAELERAVEAIPVIGDRYDAEQQKRVLG